jgi:hypothetical protein
MKHLAAQAWKWHLDGQAMARYGQAQLTARSRSVRA